MIDQPHTPDTREEATAKLPALHILMDIDEKHYEITRATPPTGD